MLVILEDINEITGLRISAHWSPDKASVIVRIGSDLRTNDLRLEGSDLSFLARKFSEYDQKAKTWARMRNPQQEGK